MKDDRTYFGFEEVSFSEKTKRVESLFSDVADHYDLMNDLMSFGMHRLWKKSFVHRLPLTEGQKILDGAGGTGDIAFQIKKSYAHRNLEIVICDLTFDMVQKGRDRALNYGLIEGLQWCCGNAEELPVPENSFDLYTNVFGMRNIGNRSKALKEAWRVLKPGGAFFCLEFSHVDSVYLAKAYDFYSFQALPLIGRWVAKDQEAYQYLAESIRTFPHQKKWQEEIQQAGFQKTQYENWMGGILALHWGYKAV